jgi:L-ascorbate 6-phosphate lactonase
MQAGVDLIEDVDDCHLSGGMLAFWRLGQQGYIVKLGGCVLYLDPYLSPSPDRLVEPVLTPGDVTNADLVLGSHDHGDHIDRAAWPAIAEASPQATFVVPEAVRRGVVADLGLPSGRVMGMDDGRSVEIAGVRVTGVAAAHEFLDQDPATGAFPYLGYVIEANGCVLYHAGDGCIYEGLATRLQRMPRLDVAFLPINGRDATRYRANCIGNMTYQEAVDLAGALRPRLTVPGHYDMFASNSGDPAVFADYLDAKYPELGQWHGTHGERAVVDCRG